MAELPENPDNRPDADEHVAGYELEGAEALEPVPAPSSAVLASPKQPIEAVAAPEEIDAPFAPESRPAARWNQSLMEVAGIEEGPPDLADAPPSQASSRDESRSAGGFRPVSTVSPATDDGVELRDASETASSAGPRRREKGTSRLGLLAMLLGIAACVLCCKVLLGPHLWIAPVPVAAGGILLGLLGLAGIVFGSGSKAGVPMLGILLSLVAMGVSAYQGGARDLGTARTWAGGQIQKYRVAALKPTVHPAAPARPVVEPFSASNNPFHPAATTQGSDSPALPETPGAVTSSIPPGNIANPGDPGGPALPSARPVPVAPVDPDAGVGAGTIFDMKNGPGSTTPGSSGRPTPAPPPAAGTGASAGEVPAVRAPGGLPGSVGAPRTPAPGSGTIVKPNTPQARAQFDPRVRAAAVPLLAARAKAQAIEDDFRFAFARTNSADYRAANAEVAAADRLVQEAKLHSDGFGLPLIEATRKRKEAQENVARIVNAAMAQDPTVIRARTDLAAAEAKYRAVYESALK